MGEAARLRVIEQFTLRQTIDTFRAIYLELPNRSGVDPGATGRTLADASRSRRHREPRPMSGPMSLEPGGAEQDTLAIRLAEPRPRRRRRPSWARRPPGRRHAHHPAARTRPDEEAVSELAAELADRVGPAVHPYEVAALLEAEGLTASADQGTVRPPEPVLPGLRPLRTGAAHLPRTGAGARPLAARHRALRCCAGVLFALPGLAYLLTAPLWNAGGHAPALIVAGLVSWAWGQALGHRAYLRMATGRREAGRTLLAGAPAGAAVATAVAALPADGGPVTLVAAGQSAYLAAAGVLLVLARERLLLAALSPLVAGAAVLPWWEPGPLLRAGLPLLAAARHPRRHRPRPVDRPRRPGPSTVPPGRACCGPCRTACSGWPRGCWCSWRGARSRTR